MYKPFHIFLLLLFGTWGSARSQSFAEAMKKTGFFYENTTEFSIAIRTDLYTKITDPKPLHTIRAGYARKGSEFLVDINGKLFVSNPRCGLVVDIPNKLLIYSKPEKHEAKTRALLNEFSNPDSLAASAMTITRVETSEKLLSYEILPKRHVPGTGSPQKTIVTLNGPDFSIQSIVYLFQPHPNTPYARIVIRYDTRVGPESVSKKNFSESRYISRKGGKPVPSPEFSDYKLIIQDKSQNPIF